jgi:thiamine-phosphate pyrophosphorylase
MTDAETRCRLVLILPEGEDLSARAAMLEGALKGGDVASVILPQYGLDDGAVPEASPKPLVPVVQNCRRRRARSPATRRVAGRVKADGIHVAGGAPERSPKAIEKVHARKIIVGGGNAPRTATRRWRSARCSRTTSSSARSAGDIKPEAHPKNVALAEWWASMVEIPCIVHRGTRIRQSVHWSIAESGAEFVALRQGRVRRPRAAPPHDRGSEVNALLDEKAPRFEQVERFA